MICPEITIKELPNASGDFVKADNKEAPKLRPLAALRSSRSVSGVMSVLVPDIVKAILDRKQGPELAMAKLMEPFLVERDQQLFGELPRLRLMRSHNNMLAVETLA